MFCFNLPWRVWERVAHFRQVLRFLQQIRRYIPIFEMYSSDSLILSQTKLRYTPKIYATNFDCLCNIHQFAHFCNKNKSIILKIMFSSIIFLQCYSKSIAKLGAVIYNNVRDGAWCSGSTWASDSHCVGSIPIAPANANTLTCGGVSFYKAHGYACIDLCAL